MGSWGIGEGQSERGGDTRPDSRGHKTVQCAGNLRSSVWLEQRIGFQGGQGAVER